MNERVTKLSAPLTQAITRDFAKWPVADVIKSASGFTGGPTAPTWEGQIQVMRDFLKARVTFLDANLPGKN